MKKILILLTFILLASFISSCGSSSTSSTTVPAATLASSAGSISSSCNSLTDSFLTVADASTRQLGASDVTATTVATVDADGWWEIEYSVSIGSIAYEITYRAKVWNSSDAVVMTLAELQSLTSATINKVWYYVTQSMTTASASYSFSFGESKTSPFIVNHAETSIDGVVAYAGTYLSEDFTTTLTYDSLTLANGASYPSGEIAITHDGTAVATMTFDATQYAIITFGAAYGSLSYVCDLATGDVTLARSL